MKRWWLILLSVVAVTTAAAALGMASKPNGAGSSPAQPTLLPAAFVERMGSEADMARGEALFSANCTACHGVTGRGDGESVRRGAIQGVPDFTRSSSLTTADLGSVYAVITDGRMERYMPPWGGILSDVERWAVALYVYSLR